MFKKISRFLLINVAPFILSLFIRVIYLTNKKNFHIEGEVLKEPFLLAFWHGESLFAPFAFKKTFGLPVKSIISDHKDGEIMRKTVEFFGIGSVRGSSRKGGAKALIGAIKSFKEGSCIAITPDGPKGPLHSIASGIVMLSQKLDANIIVFTCCPQNYWQLKSWDKYKIPKPFSQIDFYYSAPFKLTDLDEESAKSVLSEKMLKHVIYQD